MAMNGTDILVLVNTGTVLVPVFELVGCQRDVTFEETTDEIDVSCKTAREKRVLAGRYSSTISLDSLYIPGNAAYDALKEAMRNGTLIEVVRQESGVSFEQATALVTSLSEAGPDQDAATVAIAMTLDGAWTELTS